MFSSRFYRVCGWLILLVAAPIAVLYGTPQRRQSINTAVLKVIASHTSAAKRAPVAIRPVAIHAALRGTPSISLRDGQAVTTNYVGDSSASALLRSSAAQPLTLASGDFDSDGVQDLVSGYAAGTAGIITIHRGNIDALWPYGAALRNGEPPAFLPNALAIRAPEPPDFIGTGDFDADGHWDIVTAHLGSTSLYFFRGDGHGNFAAPQLIALSGNITAFTTGEINRADGLTDIVVGVTNANGSQALVFESPTGAANATPEAFALPAPATDMVLGMIEGNPMNDLAVGAGNQLMVIHGRDRKLSIGGTAQSSVAQATITQQTLPFSVQALALGSFSDSASLAALGNDGAIHLMQNSNAIAQTIKRLSAPARLQPAVRPGSSSAKVSTSSPSAASVASRSALVQTLTQAVASNSPEWTVQNDIPVPASVASAGAPMSHRFVAGHISTSKFEDLLLLDGQTNQVHVLSSITTRTPTGVASAQIKVTTQPMTLAASLDVASGPAAILPMRVNKYGLKSLVMLQSGQAEPLIVPQTPANIFTVTNTSDLTTPGGQFAPGPAGSLRLAMQNAESAGGTSEIVFNVPTSDPNFNPATGVFLFQPIAENIPGSLDFNSLPLVASGTTIDGYTQPGASPNTLAVGSNAKILVQIDGKKAATPGDSAFQLFDITGSVIRGLDVTGFGVSKSNSDGTISGADGFLEEGATDIIEGNYSGIDPTGTIAMPNVNGYEADGGTLPDPNNPQTQSSLLVGTTPQQRNVISGNNIGVIIFPKPFLAIQGNYIGLSASGTTAVPNTEDGILGGEDMTFGGTLPGAGNVITGNFGSNIDLNNVFNGHLSDNDLIQGNFIGTDPTGTKSLSNSEGVEISNRALNITVGGTTPAARNIISGNFFEGVDVSDGVSNIFIQGNFIGVDVTGTKALPNGSASAGSNNVPPGGVSINTFTALLPTGASNQLTTPFNVFVGGSVPGAGNVISGNTGNGISTMGFSNATDPNNQLFPNQNRGNFIMGNLIGTDASGVNALPNTQNGIYLTMDAELSSPAGDVTIGSAAFGSANVISFNTGNGVLIDGGGSTNSIAGNTIQHNGGAGVRVVSGTSNTISRNSIFANAALGIDLDTVGPNAVSHCQTTATGANNFQNAPTLTPGSGSAFISATATDPSGNTSEFSNAVAETLSGNVVSLLGNFDSKASTTYTIEFFSSPTADGSGFGQGQTFITSTTVTTSSACTSPISDPVNTTQADLSVGLNFSEGGATQQFSRLTVGPDFGTQVYTATITNNGPATAHNVVLTDALPAGLKVSGMYCNQPTCQSPLTTNLGNCTVSGNTVTCNLGTMASGATASVGIPVQALATGTITNSVSVAATEPDPIPANNTASVGIASQNPFTAGIQVSPTGLLSSASDTVVTVFGQGFLPTSTIAYTDPNNVVTNLSVVGFIDNQTCGNPPFSALQFCAGIQVVMPHALLAAAGIGSFTANNAGDSFDEPVNFTVASACDFGQPFAFSDPEIPNIGTQTFPFFVDVDVNIPSCTFTASSNVPWAVLTETPVSNFPGSFELAFSIAPNGGPVRTGTLTVAGQTFAISQDAGDASVCTVITNPISASLPATAGNSSVQVTPSISTCSYFNDSATSFITVTPKTDGLLVDAGTVHYSVTANPGAPRTGYIVIDGGAFTINQASATPCYFTLSTGTSLFPTNASTGSIAVTASLPTCPWTATTDSPSIANIASGASGTGNGTIQFSLAANTGGPHTVNFTVANQVGASVSAAINQASAAACTFTLTPTSVEIASAGGTSVFTMNASSPGCIGTVTSNNPTDVLAQPQSQGDVSYIVAANPGTTARTLTITAGCATFTINQDGAGVTNPVPTITSLSPSTTTAGSAAFSLIVTGTNFVNGSVVNFNGAAKTITFNSATQLTASIFAADVASAGTPPVTVTNPTPGGGTSSAVNFTITGATNPVPTITSLSPSTKAAGSASFSLIVTGTGFVSNSVVNFNGAAKTTTFNSATQVTASILAADVATVGTPGVTVTNPTPGGGTSTAATFTITAATNPVPTITTLSPSTTAAGSASFSLIVTGTNFVSGSVVNFNGAAKTTTFNSATQLTASILAADVAAVGTPGVTVTNPTPGGGTSTAATFTITAAGNPVPAITALSPSAIAAGSASFSMIVTGTGFVSSSVVNFNGAAKTTTFNSATQLTATILAADVAAAGTPGVTVTNPTPGGGTSNSLTFTVSSAPNPVPAITSLAPGNVSAGSGAFTLTVNGSNFVSNSVVQWNGSARTTTFVSSTRLTAAITAADVQTANIVQVGVFNPTPGGGTSNIVQFSITTPVPALGSLVPSSAIAGGASFPLTINGSNFLNTSVVNWNGGVRITTFVSATQLTAAITAADIATAGTASVTVFTPTVVFSQPNRAQPLGTPTGITSNALTFTITAPNPVPTLTSIAPPTTGAGGAAFTLTLTGTNFINGSTAQWKGSARTTTFVSATQLTAAITAADIASPGTAAVTVVNPTPGGGASNSLTLTITDFSVTATTTTQTVTAGSPASFAIATATVGGAFPGTVTFTASGLPIGANATFNPASVSAGTSTSMTVTTTARTLSQIKAPSYQRTTPLRPLWLIAFAMLLVLATASLAKFRKQTARRLIPISAFALLLISISYISGCSGSGFPRVGSNTSTPAGTYTVTVTGTSGTDVHTTTVTLIVQ